MPPMYSSLEKSFLDEVRDHVNLLMTLGETRDKAIEIALAAANERTKNDHPMTPKKIEDMHDEQVRLDHYGV